MKKNIIIVLFMLLVVQSALAKSSGNSITLQCSYITQHSDLHIVLEPFTLTTKGKVYRDKSIVGNVYNFDKDINKLNIEFDNGSSIYFDKEKGLSIYTVRIEGEDVYSYGSCIKTE